jgi:hypothetical protein
MFLIPGTFLMVIQRVKEEISYPSGRLASVTHLVVGGKDNENLGSHGVRVEKRVLCKWDDILVVDNCSERSLHKVREELRGTID